MDDWLAMGGYGAYVWGSYAVSLVVLLGLLVWSWRRLRAGRDLLARLERATPRRTAAGDDDGGDEIQP
jgi:heme exporter protein D